MEFDTNMFRVCVALVAQAVTHQSVTNGGSTTDHLVIHSLTSDADAAGAIGKGDRSPSLPLVHLMRCTNMAVWPLTWM